MKASTALETLFTRQFGPPRAEALASEITRIAKRLGPQRFKDTLYAIESQQGLPHPTESEMTLLLVLERVFDGNASSPDLFGKSLVGRMTHILGGVASQDMYAMLEEVCRNLRATAYPTPRWGDE